MKRSIKSVIVLLLAALIIAVNLPAKAEAATVGVSPFELAGFNYTGSRPELAAYAEALGSISGFSVYPASGGYMMNSVEPDIWVYNYYPDEALDYWYLRFSANLSSGLFKEYDIERMYLHCLALIDFDGDGTDELLAIAGNAFYIVWELVGFDGSEVVSLADGEFEPWGNYTYCFQLWEDDDGAKELVVASDMMYQGYYEANVAHYGVSGGEATVYYDGYEGVENFFDDTIEFTRLDGSTYTNRDDAYTMMGEVNGNGKTIDNLVVASLYGYSMYSSDDPEGRDVFDYVSVGVIASDYTISALARLNGLTEADKPLFSLPYTGDLAKMNLTPEMARAYADIIETLSAEAKRSFSELTEENEWYSDYSPFTVAALFDSGGVPELWVVSGTDFNYEWDGARQMDGFIPNSSAIYCWTGSSAVLDLQVSANDAFVSGGKLYLHAAERTYGYSEDAAFDREVNKIYALSGGAIDHASEETVETFIFFVDYEEERPANDYVADALRSAGYSYDLSGLNDSAWFEDWIGATSCWCFSVKDGRVISPAPDYSLSSAELGHGWGRATDVSHTYAGSWGYGEDVAAALLEFAEAERIPEAEPPAVEDDFPPDAEPDAEPVSPEDAPAPTEEKPARASRDDDEDEKARGESASPSIPVIIVAAAAGLTVLGGGAAAAAIIVSKKKKSTSAPSQAPAEPAQEAPQFKFCPECGKKLPITTQFCTNCGTKL